MIGNAPAYTKSVIKGSILNIQWLRRLHKKGVLNPVRSHFRVSKFAHCKRRLHDQIGVSSFGDPIFSDPTFSDHSDPTFKRVVSPVCFFSRGRMTANGVFRNTLVGGGWAIENFRHQILLTPPPLQAAKLFEPPLNKSKNLFDPPLLDLCIISVSFLDSNYL